MRRTPLPLIVTALCIIVSGVLATAFVPVWSGLTDSGRWYTTPIFFVAACICTAPPYLSAYMALQRNENPLTWAIAGAFVWYVAVAVLWFSDVADEEEPARPAKVERLNALARATGRPISLVDARAFSLSRWNTLRAKQPGLNATADRLTKEHGPYAAELFAADYLAFHRTQSLDAIIGGVERQVELIKERTLERARLEAEQDVRDAAVLDAKSAVERLFASANGIAAELKDRTLIAEVGGRFTRFLSGPTYRDTYNDWSTWQPLDAQEDLSFALAKIARSGALSQRPRNRLSQAL